jgi:hypothetical protein
MQIKDIVQSTDMFDNKKTFFIQDLKDLEKHKLAHKNGVEYAVLVDEQWVDVPREVVEQKPVPNVCISCEG